MTGQDIGHNVQYIGIMTTAVVLKFAFVWNEEKGLITMRGNWVQDIHRRYIGHIIRCITYVLHFVLYLI